MTSKVGDESLDVLTKYPITVLLLIWAALFGATCTLLFVYGVL